VKKIKARAAWRGGCARTRADARAARAPQDYAQQMKDANVSRAIIVVQAHLTPFARQSLLETERSKYHIEQFHEQELLVNITQHVLVPEHQLLSGARPACAVRSPLAGRLTCRAPRRALRRREAAAAGALQGEGGAAAAHPAARPRRPILRPQARHGGGAHTSQPPAPPRSLASRCSASSGRRKQPAATSRTGSACRGAF